MKCSSPFSPTGSSHAFKENPEDNITKTKDEVAIVKKTKVCFAQTYNITKSTS